VFRRATIGGIRLPGQAEVLVAVVASVALQRLLVLLGGLGCPRTGGCPAAVTSFGTLLTHQVDIFDVV
jgi:hypothetical protein